MSVQINAKKFSENSWETPGFSRTTETWPGHENTSNIETKNNDNTKATKQELVKNWSKNKADRIFFLRKDTFFASEAGIGESQT